MFRLNRNKQKTNQNSLIGSIFCYIKNTENLGFIQFFQFCSFFSVFSVCFKTVCFGCFTSIPKQKVSMFRLNRNKQKTHPKLFEREYIWVIFRKFRVVLVCFGLLRNSSFCLGCFDINRTNKHKNFFVFDFTKQTETNPKQILIRFVSVQTEIYFCFFRGHPSWDYQIYLVLVCFNETSCYF